MIQLWHDGQNTSKNKIETRSDGKLGYFFIVKDCTLEKRARRTGKSPKHGHCRLNQDLSLCIARLSGMEKLKCTIISNHKN